MKMLPRLVLAVAFGLAALHADDIVYRDNVVIANDNERAVLDAFIGHAKNAANVNVEKARTKLQEEGVEMFAWVDFKNLDMLNTAYELTGDTQYLDLFKQGFQPYYDMVAEFSDGYRGWQGTPIPPRRDKENPGKQIEELQMTFRGIYILGRWVALAKSNGDYAAANEATIKQYLDLCENDLFPKWDQRGFWTMFPHAGGVYHGLDYPGDGTSLSFEKLSIMVEGLLALYDATGNTDYLKRALQIGAWFKSNLILKDGHYEWMSWVPAGPWDINPEDPSKWKVSWMANEPNGAWYVTALSIALSLYQRGLLFDDEDLARFVKTQKEMCWNGDLEKPEWRNTAGETSKWIKGVFFSFQLAPYDDTLVELGFHGYLADQAFANKDSSWKGGVLANEYLYNKYIILPEIANHKQPMAAVGEVFLADAGNKAFYERLKAFALPTTAEPPRAPAMMFADPKLAVDAYSN